MARVILAMIFLLVMTVGVVPAQAARPAAPPAAGGTDISSTAEGKARIDETAASFTALGSPTAKADLVASRLPDGGVLVTPRGLKVERTDDGEFRAVTPARDSSADGPLALGAGRIALADHRFMLAAGSWTLLGSQCFAAYFLGAAHMDTCYKRYKMSSDGDASKDYWRLDLYATMFAEGRTLDWGWVAGDRDAGPALSFVDWSPDSDVAQGCGTFGLSVSVAGVGGGFTKTFCEFNNISKSAGSSVGWFKDHWSWDQWQPMRDRDRSVAIIIGASSSQGTGTPTWGVSWNFAAH